MHSVNRNSFTPLIMTITVPIWTKFSLGLQLFVNNSYAKFQENQTKGVSTQGSQNWLCQIPSWASCSKTRYLTKVSQE
jgi:hypothetical protein